MERSGLVDDKLDTATLRMSLLFVYWQQGGKDVSQRRERTNTSHHAYQVNGYIRLNGSVFRGFQIGTVLR
jgi:hypothetical protein